MLSPRLSLAHCTWASEADLKLLAETGASISHNPSSNLRLRAGHAPLPAMLRLIPGQVGLGLDGNAMADDDDYFAEMRLALHLHRAPTIGTRTFRPQAAYDSRAHFLVSLRTHFRDCL